MVRVLLSLVFLLSVITSANAQLVVHSSKLARRLDRRLSRPIELKLGDVEVGEFAAALSSKIGFRVFVDRVALESDLSIPNPRLNANLSSDSVRQALDRILIPQGLIWEMHAGTIEITSPEDATMMPRVYVVSELVRDKHRAKDLAMLNEVITWHADPNAWPESGPAITPLKMTRASVLVITQTEAMHYEIRRLLRSLRRANRK